MLKDCDPGWGLAWHSCEVPSPEAQSLRPQFDRLMTRWVPKRQHEFLAGRWCVQQCYAHLGIAANLPGINRDRSPAWPDGVRGSISHCDTLALAVVARDTDVSLVGVDVESIAAMAQADRALDSSIAHQAEIIRLKNFGCDHEQAMTLLFSAKESLYKALYPKVGRYFDYLDAEVDAMESDVLVLRLRIKLADAFPAGRLFRLQYQINDHHVLTFLTETG